MTPRKSEDLGTDLLRRKRRALSPCGRGWIADAERGGETGEGSLSACANADRDPSPAEHLTMLVTLSHKGRGGIERVASDQLEAMRRT
jgi:hypothetical protein